MTRRTELLAESYRCGEYAGRVFQRAPRRTPAAAALRRRGA